MPQFYYSKTGEDIHGPIDEPDLIALYQAKSLPNSTKIRTTESEEWFPLDSVLQIERATTKAKSGLLIPILGIVLFLAIIGSVGGYFYQQQKKVEQERIISEGLAKEKAAREAKEREPYKLSGSMFIVTKGGENIKLGLVTVGIYSQEFIGSFLNKFAGESKATLGKLKLQIPPLQEKVDEARAETKSADETVKLYDKERKVYSEARSNISFFEPTSSSDLNSAQIQAWHTYDARVKFDQQQIEKSKNIYFQKSEIEKSLHSNLSDLRIQVDDWNETFRNKLFNSLPNPLFFAKTDADGKFSISIPPKENYVLVARATRTIPGTPYSSEENYYWLISLPPKDSPARSIMLSNDNMLPIMPPEQIMPLPFVANTQ